MTIKHLLSILFWGMAGQLTLAIALAFALGFGFEILPESFVIGFCASGTFFMISLFATLIILKRREDRIVSKRMSRLS